jgi:hypothetical protein
MTGILFVLAQLQNPVPVVTRPLSWPELPVLADSQSVGTILDRWSGMDSPIFPLLSSRESSRKQAMLPREPRDRLKGDLPRRGASRNSSFKLQGSPRFTELRFIITAISRGSAPPPGGQTTTGDRSFFGSMFYFQPGRKSSPSCFFIQKIPSNNHGRDYLTEN